MLQSNYYTIQPVVHSAQVHFFSLPRTQYLYLLCSTKRPSYRLDILCLRVAKFKKNINEEGSIDFVALDEDIFLRPGRHRMIRICFMVDGERGTSIT